jgi:heptosyltransferase-2
MSQTLVIAPNWIGDAVMSEPFIRCLSESFGQVTILATPWVAPVYRAMPSKPAVIEGDFSHGKVELTKRRQISQLIKDRRFDQVFVLPNSWKSILIPVLAKIPQIFGYQGELRSAFLIKYLPNPPKKNRPPMVDHYLNLAKLINIQLDPLQEKRPQLHVEASTQNQAKDVLQSLPHPEKFYILAPGAEFGPAKQWPVQHFAKLATQLLQYDPTSSIVLLGSSKDRVICDEILQEIDTNLRSNVLNLCGLASLDQSIALIPLAKGLASNDSGLMHIAAAFGIPQIAFYGSSDPKHTPPLSPFAGILFLGLDCSPCHQRKCPLGHLNCLNQITPQSAFDELNRCITLRNIN